MPRPKGVELLVEAIFTLDLRPFLAVVVVDTQLSSVSPSISVSQLYDILVEKKKVVCQKRPLYTIIDICYAAGILQKIQKGEGKEKDNRDHFMWNKEYLASVLPKDTLWFDVTLSTRRDMLNRSDNGSVKIQTQKTIHKLLELDGRMVESVVKLAQLIQMDQRRLYEILTVLVYTHVVKKATHCEKTRGRNRKRKTPSHLQFKVSSRFSIHTMPVLGSRRKLTFDQPQSIISTRSQKRQRRQKQQDTILEECMTLFKYDPEKVKNVFNYETS